MSDRIVITVLVENSAHEHELVAEDGLALHVQAGEQSMLFDTGQSGLLASNARCLGVDLARIQAIGLSHDHYDHTGFPQACSACNVGSRFVFRR
jgi:7,8-dihydropterin-6-yl-methyl-4-(beta-D-ribofuranosyl)aminobenzene 5'-phosphate synthase